MAKVNVRRFWRGRSERTMRTRCSISWVGPMLAAESACIAEGIRAIDVRHEQARDDGSCLGADT